MNIALRTFKMTANANEFDTAILFTLDVIVTIKVICFTRVSYILSFTEILC